MISLAVSKLLKDKELGPHLTCLAGAKGLKNKIYIPYIQKPGLALTGDMTHVHTGRVQIWGTSEIRYINKLPPHLRNKNILKFCKSKISCIIVTRSNPIPGEVSAQCEKNAIPLLVTPLGTPTFINKITKFLSENLTPSAIIHGVLIDIYGIGILLLGKSGIGKSETALELVMHGHRLVADDIIHVRKKPPSFVYGIGSDLIKFHMEIRGLGIINIQDLFGISSVRDQKLIELVIELVEWDENDDYERLGVTDQTHNILDVPIPFLRIPVRPGRNLTAIIEVAARNQLLKIKGHHSALALQEKLTRKLLEGEDLHTPEMEFAE